MGSVVRPRTRVVLFVDDDEDVRTLYGNALRDAGFLVDEAGGVHEGIDRAVRFRPDLLVLDRYLRDGDGWDVARRLKSHATTKAVPIVGFSVRGMRDDMESALVAGCDSFIEKPCTREALVRHVRGMLALPLESQPPRALRSVS